MKIQLSDICSRCCPEELEGVKLPRKMAARLKENVMGQIEEKPHKSRKILRTALIAAIVAAVLSTAAFAVARFGLNIEETAGTLEKEMAIYDEEGEILNSMKCVYPDAGMIISISGEEKERSSFYFRASYLPTEPQHSDTDGEGWAGWADKNTEYEIFTHTLQHGENQFVIRGVPEILDERYWDDWHVLSISTDCSENTAIPTEKPENIVFLYNEENGWVTWVSGTESVEELEKIAANLEFKSGDKIPDDGLKIDYITLLNPGNG